MKIYLAARYERMIELRTYRDDLEKMGHVVTSCWLSGVHDKLDPLDAARNDCRDVVSSDCVISFTEIPESAFGRGGRHVEFGVALARGKRAIVVGHRENVFHHLPEAEFYPTWGEARAAIGAEPKLDLRKLKFVAIDMDDRVDGSYLPLPDGVRRLSEESRMQMLKAGLRQMTLASRFRRRS